MVRCLSKKTMQCKRVYPVSGACACIYSRSSVAKQDRERSRSHPTPGRGGGSGGGRTGSSAIVYSISRAYTGAGAGLARDVVSGRACCQPMQKHVSSKSLMLCRSPRAQDKTIRVCQAKAIIRAVCRSMVGPSPTRESN